MYSYSCLRGRGDNHDNRFIEVVESRLRAVLEPALRTVNFDEQWYLTTYADVRDAIRSGSISTAKEHYISFGYFEDRWPRKITVDEGWYLTEYADVAEAIRMRGLESGQQHFEKSGFQEGRIPFPGWTLYSDDGNA